MLQVDYLALDTAADHVRRIGRSSRRAGFSPANREKRDALGQRGHRAPRSLPGSADLVVALAGAFGAVGDIRLAIAGEFLFGVRSGIRREGQAAP
jgi:hypothetical protein